MNLYLVTCDLRQVADYDYYSSFVCVAQTEEAASKVLPSPFITEGCEWHSESATAQLIGTADASLAAGQVIVTSFHAG
jgi:hypothetical protein